MIVTHELAQLAGEAARFFETRERSNGEQYIARREDAPEWVLEMILAAHDGKLPDDYTYACICDALEAIRSGEGRELELIAGEMADEGDLHTAALLEWVKSSEHRIGYVDDELAGWAADMPPTLTTVVRLAQTRERHEVFEAVAEQLQARCRAQEH